MTIFRVEHNKNYTVINNTICKDNRLSWKAKGIWLYAFSRPDDWTFHENDLLNQSTDGRASLRAGLKELEDFCYLVREQNKNEKGQFIEANWIFHETPFKIISPKTENLSTVKQLAENLPILNTDLNLNTETTTPAKEVVVFSDLKISEGLKKSILKKHAIEDIAQAVKRVKAWTDRTSDEAAILTCLERKDSWSDEVLTDPNENKIYAQSLLPFENECYKLELMNKQAEITYFNCQKDPFCLKYDELGFKTKLLTKINELKEKYEIYKN